MTEEELHMDSVGEYQSEYIKVSFDVTSADLYGGGRIFGKYKDIMPIDLNELGYKTHYAKDGEQ
jgi:hypothetical protein